MRKDGETIRVAVTVSLLRMAEKAQYLLGVVEDITAHVRAEEQLAQLRPIGAALNVRNDSIAKAGSMLGSGAIIVVDDSISIVDVALKTAKFYRHESCGKCTPCREGTNWTVKMLERIDNGDATPMDLDIMASVQEQIIGNCLCVLGDAMAMPIGSMIKHFREEFEAHIEAARERNGLGVGPPQVNRDEHAGPIYEFTCEFAKLEPPPPEMQQLLGAVAASQEAMDDFVSMTAGTLPAPEFFAPDWSPKPR